jgi:hypothetical protein
VNVKKAESMRWTTVAINFACILISVASSSIGNSILSTHVPTGHAALYALEGSVILSLTTTSVWTVLLLLNVGGGFVDGIFYLLFACIIPLFAQALGGAMHSSRAPFVWSVEDASLGLVIVLVGIFLASVVVVPLVFFKCILDHFLPK